jgi:hypothetical protein
MPEKAKTEAIAQITLAVRGLEVAIDKLQEAYAFATFSEQGELLELITELGERLDVNRVFLAHIKASEVTVKTPAADAYAKLDKALAKLHALEVQSAAVSRVLNVAAALGRAAKSTRKEVSTRAT